MGILSKSALQILMGEAYRMVRLHLHAYSRGRC